MKDAAFDLLGIIVVSGLLLTLYQARKKAITKSWFKYALFTLIVAGAVSYALLNLYGRC